jgi:hypothetical protein
MRRIRWAVFAIAAVISSSCDRLERQEKSFSSLDEATEAGAVERGIVPSWIPQHATDLRVGHDLDTNERWLRFTVPDDVAPGWHEKCSPTSASRVLPVLAKLAEDVKWWPPDLYQSVKSGSEKIEVLDCVERGAHEECLIVDGDLAGFFWSAPH